MSCCSLPGDDVCADGRIIQAASLQIDESGLTGESVPASKSADPIADETLGVGDQANMAFMNSPVTHGSGVMIVTGTGSDTEVGRISGMLKSTPTLKTPLTAQLDTLTLWIAGAAGLTIAIMFALGISRDQSTQTIFTTAIALALAAVPMAMPTVLQVILSKGSTTLAAHGAVVKSLSSVETLGSTSAINSDKTGTLTMNQVTVVEVLDPTDRYAITGMGYGLDGEVEHAAGNTNTIEEAILPVPDRQRRQARRRQGRGRSHRGSAARPRAQGQAGRRGHAGRVPPARDAAVRPHVQAHGRLRRCQGCHPGRRSFGCS